MVRPRLIALVDGSWQCEHGRSVRSDT